MSYNQHTNIPCIARKALITGAAVVAATIGLTASFITPASAYETIVAHSRHGNGSITAPVRSARNGYQVRLPGGNWIYCRRSCAETLRVETVDIFETQGSLTGYGTRMNECGIFGCLEIGVGR